MTTRHSLSPIQVGSSSDRQFSQPEQTAVLSCLFGVFSHTGGSDLRGSLLAWERVSIRWWCKWYIVCQTCFSQWNESPAWCVPHCGDWRWRTV